ncbi:hypothetical protein BKA56DRAFT_677912 [Ilyonectria sp. MPI-CAGE-AT-0026]|nr:hypothetical protein BKA56DRAFT_677912 [Ilyonectria sp. MPI-CAGE-AT-0026]
MDFGDEHSEVTGFDLSPILPSFVPTNVRFIIDDIDEECNYSEPFDYMHTISPDEYVEVQDIGVDITSDDGSLTEQHARYKWSQLLKDGPSKTPPSSSAGLHGLRNHE